jgi:hypothetical protein
VFRFGDGNSSAVVLLVFIDKSIVPEILNPICEVQLTDGTWIQKQAEIWPIHDASSSEGCRLRNYRFLCHSLEKVPNEKLDETPVFKLKIGEAKSAEVIKQLTY